MVTVAKFTVLLAAHPNGVADDDESTAKSYHLNGNKAIQIA